jgi:hypothetical protein
MCSASIAARGRAQARAQDAAHAVEHSREWMPNGADKSTAITSNHGGAESAVSLLLWAHLASTHDAMVGDVERRGDLGLRRSPREAHFRR